MLGSVDGPIRTYLCHTFAEKVISQVESNVQMNMRAAIPLVQVVAGVAREHPVVDQLVLAKMHEVGRGGFGPSVRLVSACSTRVQPEDSVHVYTCHQECWGVQHCIGPLLVGAFWSLRSCRVLPLECVPCDSGSPAAVVHTVGCVWWRQLPS